MATFVAVTEAGWIGLAGGYPDNPPELVSMWVAPAGRGTGAASALIDAVAGWARDGGATELDLWVVEGNDRARRAYERAGFVATGAVQPVRPGEPRMESRMRLLLRDRPA